MGIRESGPAWRAAGEGPRGARKALRPLWRALPFHARYRISRALQPARWSCMVRRADHRRRLLEVLDRHRGLPIVLYVPHQEWNDLFQRPQQLCRAFADRGALALYLTPGIRRDGEPGPVEVGPRLWVLNVAERVLGAVEGAVAVLSWLPGRSLLRTLRPRKVVYDYMDDLTIFYGGGRRMRRDHQELVRRADLVACSARVLADEVRGMGVEPLLLPNGVDPARFAPTGRVPEDLAPLLARGRPVIGYHGTLARWFDYALLIAAARARPAWEFVLVGPADFDDAWDREALARQPNIHWLGPKAHEELPDYLAGFDVAMIPFKAGPITRACSPIKLFECLAAGKPVVSAGLEECRATPGAIAVEGEAAFLAGLERALAIAHDPPEVALRRAEAARSSWTSRVDALWHRLLGERLPACSGGTGRS